MNYIHKLQEQRLDLLEAIVEAHNYIDELLAYLESPKFHTDTTVQVKDVLSRLLPARSALIHGEHCSDTFRKEQGK